MSPTMRLGYIVLCALVPVSIGCGGGHTPETSLPGMQSSRDGSLFSLLEYTEDGDALEYPRTPAMIDVDINSTVRIALDHHAISTVDKSDPELVAALHTLRTLQKSYSDVVIEDRQGHLDALQFYRATPNPTKKQVDEINEKLEKTGKAVQAAYGELEKYILATEGEEQGYELISEQQLVSNTNHALDYIAGEHSRLQNQVGKQSGLFIELSAWIDDQQLHLPGYDNLAPGPARPASRNNFSFGESFQAELKAAQDLAASARKQNDFREQVVHVLRSSANDIVAQAQAAVNEWEQKGRQTLAALGELTLPKGVKLDETTKLIETATTGTHDCTTGIAQIEALIQKIRSALGMADPKSALPGLLPELQNSYKAVKQCANKAAAVAKLAGPALAEVKTALGSGLPADAKSKLDKAKSLIADAEAAIDEFSRDVRSLRMATQVANDIPPELSSVRHEVTRAPNTELNLVTSKRKHGDIITVRAQVLRSDNRVVAETIRHIKVHTRGWGAAVGASVMWVHVRGQASDSSLFQPSAGAYGVFRYRGKRGAKDAHTGAGAVIEPGFGVLVLAVPRQDGSTHMAWMATMQLFNDIFQVGAGINMDGSFVVGFGLGLQKLVGFGKTFD